MTGAEIRRLFTKDEINAIHNIVTEILDDKEQLLPRGNETLDLFTRASESLGAPLGDDVSGDPDEDEDYLSRILFADTDTAKEPRSEDRDDKWHADLIDVFRQECSNLSTMENREALYRGLVNGLQVKSETAVSIHIKLLHVFGHVTRDVMEKFLSARSAITVGDARRTLWTDLALKIPFGVNHPVEPNIEGIEGELDRTVFGMSSAKRKLMEHISLLRYSSTGRMDPVLLLGEPGVGKTHLAKAVAEALSLPFVKIQLAGNYDVAAMKGSAPTWNSSGPGMLFRSLVDSGCENPVFLLDEIDKSGGTSAGSIITLLTELLDVSQNNAYMDAFVQVPLDFSKVMFLCTANDINLIPGYILDRCHIIKIENYTREERQVIIQRYLPAQLVKEMGLNRYRVKVSETVAERLSEIESLRSVKMALKSLIVRKLVETDGKADKMVVDRADDDVLGEYGGTGTDRRSIGFHR
ncbi:MAG: AAA family ATPase [Thermodesulfovibrionales bacterium]